MGAFGCFMVSASFSLSPFISRDYMTHWQGATLIRSVWYLHTSLRKQKGKSRRGSYSYSFFIQGAFIWAPLLKHQASTMNKIDKIPFPMELIASWQRAVSKPESGHWRRFLAPQPNGASFFSCDLSMCLPSFLMQTPWVIIRVKCSSDFLRSS